MKPSIEREQRLFDALKRITRYMSPDELRRTSEKKYGLDGEEAIEMAYENVLQEAHNAIKGLRRPVSNAGVTAVAPADPQNPRCPGCNKPVMEHGKLCYFCAKGYTKKAAPGVSGTHDQTFRTTDPDAG